MTPNPQTELFLRDNAWINALVLDRLPPFVAESLPLFFQTWLRNFVFAFAVYFVVGGLWCYYVYYCFRFQFYKDGKIPLVEDILQQVYWPQRNHAAQLISLPFMSL